MALNIKNPHLEALVAEVVAMTGESKTDCMTYATASLTGEPLLCVGDDFPQTDLELVEWA